VLRAQLNLERGRLLKAWPDVERAIALYPRDPRAFLVSGRIRLERGELQALPDLKRAAELSRHEDATVLHWLATALYQAGQRDEALAIQRQAVKLRPQDSELVEQLRAWERMSYLHPVGDRAGGFDSRPFV
jgi:tetratricopeptide (TPR) repeat protein